MHAENAVIVTEYTLSTVFFHNRADRECTHAVPIVFGGEETPAFSFGWCGAAVLDEQEQSGIRYSRMDRNKRGYTASPACRLICIFQKIAKQDGKLHIGNRQRGRKRRLAGKGDVSLVAECLIVAQHPVHNQIAAQQRPLLWHGRENVVGKILFQTIVVFCLINIVKCLEMMPFVMAKTNGFFYFVLGFSLLNACSRVSQQRNEVRMK